MCARCFGYRDNNLDYIVNKRHYCCLWYIPHTMNDKVSNCLSLALNNTRSRIQYTPSNPGHSISCKLHHSNYIVDVCNPSCFPIDSKGNQLHKHLYCTQYQGDILICTFRIIMLKFTHQFTIPSYSSYYRLEY